MCQVLVAHHWRRYQATTRRIVLLPDPHFTLIVVRSWPRMRFWFPHSRQFKEPASAGWSFAIRALFERFPMIADDIGFLIETRA